MSQPEHTPKDRNTTPHIRLNSNAEDLVTDEPPRARPPMQQQAGRPLVPRVRGRPASRPRPPPLNPFSDRNASTESAELLLPPKKSRVRRYKDEESPFTSPLASPALSRRTSMSSDSPNGTMRSFGPFATPYDSRAPSRAGSDELGVNTQNVLSKLNITPSEGLLLFPEDVEKDDYLHNPDPNEKESRECNIFTKRGALNIGGLIFLTLGVLMLFIGYPVITFIEKEIHPDAYDCGADPSCISADLPLLQNVRRGLIDPDTPASAYTRTASDGSTQNLVFSDEFNTPGRSFYGGDDPFWQAVDLWYGVTQDLEWYDPQMVTTEDGTLTITFANFPSHGLKYTSGMVQSWNQLCFKGGYVEASISLPGAGAISGFWPGFWTMGNLGRPGFSSTTDGTWPYSYSDACDMGITANQSSPDGTSFLPGMRYPACTCEGQDHPNGAYGGVARSAPEIDALEASVGPLNGVNNGQVSQSAQLAPFDIWYYPNYDFIEVYDSSITSMNSYTGGPYQQAISGLTYLNNEWYDGQAYQTYAFEYEPGDSGYITWYVGQDKTWKLDARATGPNGNVAQRPIPNEPMAMVMNFGMSYSFANVELADLVALMPAVMRFDYVRIYQGSGDYVTCDPPSYPTTEFIANHPKAYLNYQVLRWEDTGYTWPTNSFVTGC